MPLSLYGVGSVPLLHQPWVTADLEHLLQRQLRTEFPDLNQGAAALILRHPLPHLPGPSASSVGRVHTTAHAGCSQAPP